MTMNCNVTSGRYTSYHHGTRRHFSPDQRWIIFRANFEGVENVYAVSIVKEK